MLKEEVKTVHYFHAGSLGILPIFIAVIALVFLNSAFAEKGHRPALIWFLLCKRQPP